MEETDKINQSGPILLPNSASTNGEEWEERRIEELDKTLALIEPIFCKAGEKLFTKIIFLIFICLIIIIFFIGYCFYLFNSELPGQWTWQVAYYAALRVTFMSAIFTAIAFIIKLTRSYIHMYEHNRHKQTIIKSMAHFVGAGTTGTQRDLVYYKLMELVVHFGNIGIITKESDVQNKEITSELFEKIFNKRVD